MKTIAVLCSGGDQILNEFIQALENDAQQDIALDYVINDDNAEAMLLALEYDLPTWLIEADENPSERINLIIDTEIDWLIDLGFNSELSDDFKNKWKDKLIQFDSKNNPVKSIVNKIAG